MAKKQQLTYQEALNEIEQIVANIENNKYSIDELGDKVRRVAELVKFCKEKLKYTEAELNKIIEENKRDESN
ncbi:MAG: exodeoxyribonuclease VII small subunit [Bacteroidales bacterium]|nr:exodeoxyribonuclease VII small subunit [Bacteroidales bacterium]